MASLLHWHVLTRLNRPCIHGYPSIPHSRPRCCIQTNFTISVPAEDRKMKSPLHCNKVFFNARVCSGRETTLTGCQEATLCSYYPLDNIAHLVSATIPRVVISRFLDSCPPSGGASHYSDHAITWLQHKRCYIFLLFFRNDAGRGAGVTSPRN